MEYNVLLVESNRLMIEQLSNVINETEGFSWAARYQDPADALGQGAVFNPNLIMLDVEANPVSLLDDFKRMYPDTSIVCLGDHWNAETASMLVRAGARGYLIKPFTSDELKKALKTFGKSGMEVSSEVIAFFSPKGKSGKTTLIANLAMSLARKSGEQVGIIDADLQFGDMAVFFNLEPRSTIVEAVRDINFLSPISLNGYFMPVNDQVQVLCGTKNPSLGDKVEMEPFNEMVTMAKGLFRYILIDMPPGFCPMSIEAAEMSDVTYLVAMINGAYEVKHMRRALEIFEDWPDYKERVKTVFTRVSPCDLQQQQTLEQMMGYPVEGILPNAYMVVSNAADNGSMALDLEPNSQLAKSINLLADRLMRRRQKIDWGKS